MPAPILLALSPARKKIIDNAVRDFHLGGAELTNTDKVRFADIQKKYGTLTTRFSENVLDATNDYALFINDEAELDGLPDDAKEGYKFTLHFPSYFPVLQYADNRALREKIYHTNATTKVSTLGNKPEWDNMQNIVDILQLPNEEARLLGLKNYAVLSLVSKINGKNTPGSHQFSGRPWSMCASLR